MEPSRVGAALGHISSAIAPQNGVGGIVQKCIGQVFHYN